MDSECHAQSISRNVAGTCSNDCALHLDPGGGPQPCPGGDGREWIHWLKGSHLCEDQEKTYGVCLWSHSSTWQNTSYAKISMVAAPFGIWALGILAPGRNDITAFSTDYLVEKNKSYYSWRPRKSWASALLTSQRSGTSDVDNLGRRHVSNDAGRSRRPGLCRSHRGYTRSSLMYRCQKYIFLFLFFNAQFHMQHVQGQLLHPRAPSWRSEL